MSPTVSVVIPAYNAEGFIARTLTSVLRQTMPPSEIIVVNDASPDGTAAQVEAVARTADIPIRLINLERNCGGPARPLNVGVREARGTLIATLDHDDCMLPRRLEVQVPALMKYSDVGLVLGPVVCNQLASSRAYYVSHAQAILHSVPGEPVEGGCRRISHRVAYAALSKHGCFPLTCSTFTFRKQVWEAVGGFNERIVTTCDFAFLEAVTRDFDLICVPEPVAEWTASETCLSTRSRVNQRARDMLTVYYAFDRERLGKQGSEDLDAALGELDAGFAYKLREHGYYWDALGWYFRWLVRTRDPRAVTGAVKTCLKLLTQPLRLNRAPQV